MRIANTEHRYGLVSKAFHWTIALLILGLIGLGWYMVGLTYYDPLYHDSLTWHKALGMAVLGLAAAKIAWTFAARQPAPSPSLTRAERIAFRVVHDALILLMILMPLTGYMIAISAGDPVDIPGLFAVPALFSVSDAVRDLAVEAHYYLTYGCGLLAALHAGAALKHHVVDKSDVLRRMTADCLGKGRT